MNIPIEEAFAFAEFMGLHYIRLHEVWVYKYSDQRNKDNWRTTETLYEIWKLTRNHGESSESIPSV
jgi:hypothetical protein